MSFDEPMSFVQRGPDPLKDKSAALLRTLRKKGEELGLTVNFESMGPGMRDVDGRPERAIRVSLAITAAKEPSKR
jgi:hypothetical protein